MNPEKKKELLWRKNKKANDESDSIEEVMNKSKIAINEKTFLLCCFVLAPKCEHLF